jgi:hypothetical protein
MPAFISSYLKSTLIKSSSGPKKTSHTRLCRSTRANAVGSKPYPETTTSMPPPATPPPERAAGASRGPQGRWRRGAPPPPANQGGCSPCSSLEDLPTASASGGGGGRAPQIWVSPDRIWVPRVWGAHSV